MRNVIEVGIATKKIKKGDLVKKSTGGKVSPIKAKVKRQRKPDIRDVATLPDQFLDEKQALKSLEVYVKGRQALMAFIKQELVEGKDYGEMWDGDSKKNIYKAGCEKVQNWLKLSFKLFEDWQGFEMMGKPAKTVCYNGYLVREKDIPLIHSLIKEFHEMGVKAFEETAYKEIAVASGKGAASVNGTTVKDPNVAVKKGKIRCFKDAILGLGLSGEFTQDADDYGHGESPENGEATKPPQATQPKQEAKQTKKTKALTVESLKEEALKLIKFELFTPNQKSVFEGKIEDHFKAGNINALEAVVDSLRRQKKYLEKQEA